MQNGESVQPPVQPVQPLSFEQLQASASSVACGSLVPTKRFDASAGQYYTECEFNEYYCDGGAQWDAAAAYPTLEEAQRVEQRGMPVSQKRVSRFVGTNPLMTLPMPGGNKKKRSIFTILNPLSGKADTAPAPPPQQQQHLRAADLSGDGGRKTTALTFGNMGTLHAQF